MRAYIELLQHFSCPHCDQWFTIADKGFKLGDSLTCPYVNCAKASEITEVKNGQQKEVVGVKWIYPDGQPTDNDNDQLQANSAVIV